MENHIGTPEVAEEGEVVDEGVAGDVDVVGEGVEDVAAAAEEDEAVAAAEEVRNELSESYLRYHSLLQLRVEILPWVLVYFKHGIVSCHEHCNAHHGTVDA